MKIASGLLPIGPPVALVPADVHRPKWSVMVPTFNCARFLKQTLNSILIQDRGPELMEIIVVDDVSNDDPESVVAQVGLGRVKFYRNEYNLGATKNFNRCIESASGELIHILHGDDYLERGFYDEIEKLCAMEPSVALYSTRTIAVEEDGTPIWLSPRVKSLERGSRDVSACVMQQQFQTASVVVRRSFYEVSGGFDVDLVHVADWEMWVRAIRIGGGMMSKKLLAYYRTFEGNDTGRLLQTGDNIRDQLKLVSRFSGLPGFNPNAFRASCMHKAKGQMHTFKTRGNHKAAEANRDVYVQLRTTKELCRDSLGWIFR